MMIEVSAPSNIALIKYMGKEQGNIPANASLSYSLKHLRTRLSLQPAEFDDWQALDSDYPIVLSEKGKARYLAFFAQLKEYFGLQGNFLLRSANNFPSDCGLASSASSFAALTLGAYELFVQQQPGGARGFKAQLQKDLPLLSALSRRGSGSSCRSLYPEWALWEGETARELEFPLRNLQHLAVIVEEQKKEVSSSEAHLRVNSSLLMQGRRQRAEQRLQELQAALQTGNWAAAYEICWAEFWDMHALFESSRPSFGYMNAASLAVLEICRAYWRETGDGPLVTMDAGPNVHLLFRREQEAAYRELSERLQTYKLWGSEASE